jgi:hypothetical protein
MARKPSSRKAPAKPVRPPPKVQGEKMKTQGFNPRAPIRENDSEDAGGAYDNDRGETDLAQP